MKNTSVILLLFGSFFLLSNKLPAQLEQVIQPIINYSIDGPYCKFTAEVPVLKKRAGAPRDPFVEYFWEFGDGHYSRQAQPRHIYEKPGVYEVRLYLTNNYAEGIVKAATRNINIERGNPETRRQTYPLSGPIGLQTNHDPKPGEEMVVILAYKNTMATALSGKLLLYYNQKQFKYNHFTFSQERYPKFDVVQKESTLNRALLPMEASLNADLIFDLRTAEQEYRELQSWRFSNLVPGEHRHIFLSLMPSAATLQDTNSLVSITAAFIPDGGGIGGKMVELNLKIVKAHDPNKMSVKPRSMSFRGILSKKLHYTVDFQNKGEGNAETVEVVSDIPEGLNPASFKIKKWEPECALCGPGVFTNCLDTLVKGNKIHMEFKGISLAGLESDDIEKRSQSKGFVEYSLEPQRKVKKKTLVSRALILMPPDSIHTNRVRTRFATGISPGVRAGYAVFPDAKADNYYFLGFTLSPYKPYGLYPQLEFVPGFSVDNQETIIQSDTTFRCVPDFNNTMPSTDSICFPDDLTIRKSQISQNVLGFDLAGQVKYDFDFVSVGVGGQLSIQKFKGSRVDSVSFFNYDSPRFYPTGQGYSEGYTYNEWRTRPSVFADVALGKVRNGPYAGFRYYYLFKGERREHFQLYAGWRF